jgi:hypothetical protein
MELQQDCGDPGASALVAKVAESPPGNQAGGYRGNLPTAELRKRSQQVMAGHRPSLGGIPRDRPARCSVPPGPMKRPQARAPNLLRKVCKILRRLLARLTAELALERIGESIPLP